MVFMEKSIYLSINLGRNEQLVRVTVAYSDTFPVAGGCHCKRLALYLFLPNIFCQLAR